MTKMTTGRSWASGDPRVRSALKRGWARAEPNGLPRFPTQAGPPTWRLLPAATADKLTP